MILTRSRRTFPLNNTDRRNIIIITSIKEMSISLLLDFYPSPSFLSHVRLLRSRDLWSRVIQKTISSLPLPYLPKGKDTGKREKRAMKMMEKMATDWRHPRRLSSSPLYCLLMSW